MAEEHNFVWDAGDTKQLKLSSVDSDGLPNEQQSGKIQLRELVTSNDVALEVDAVLEDANTLVFTFEPQQSGELVSPSEPVKVFFYDAQCVDIDGNVSTLIKGTITFTLTTTRPW
ncbi:hypothetical protein QTO12_05895 [Vibrio owensii]|uniref:hypothetical protein n=1 Tax=Vibrio owensii TaxID=696485 RepID=UPI002F42E58E